MRLPALRGVGDGLGGCIGVKIMSSDFMSLDSPVLKGDKED